MNFKCILEQYKPLIDEDFNEIEAFKAYKKGEISLDYIIAQYYRFAIKIAKSFDNTMTPIEDRISIAFIGLIKAVDKFNPERGIKFTTFCGVLMKNEILMELRKIRNRSKIQMYNLEDVLAIDSSNGKELKLEDVVADDSNIEKDIEKKFLFQEVMKILEDFPEREQKIIKLKFFNNMKQKELAEQLGYSQPHISRLEKKILEKLNKKVLVN